MSRRELERVEVMGRVGSGDLGLQDAATMLGLSYRQTKRVWRRYRERGRSPDNSRVVALHSLCDFYRRADNQLTFSCSIVGSPGIFCRQAKSIRHSTRVRSDSPTAACQSISRQADEAARHKVQIEQRAEDVPGSILLSSRQNAQYLGGSSCPEQSVCDALYGRGPLSPQSDKGPPI
jgi:hypothetical protein